MQHTTPAMALTGLLLLTGCGGSDSGTNPAPADHAPAQAEDPAAALTSALTGFTEADIHLAGLPMSIVEPDLLRAIRQRAEAALRCLEAYPKAIHLARLNDPEQATQLEQQLASFQQQLPQDESLLHDLADPDAEWDTAVHDVTVDAKTNANRNRLAVEADLQPGDVVFVFPHPDDTWYTGRYDWVDFRGRPNLGRGAAPTMRLRANAPGVNRATLTLGYHFRLTDPGRLTLHCEDQWPDNNQGAIRVTVIVLRPR